MGVFPKELHLVWPMRSSSEPPIVIGIENACALEDSFLLARLHTNVDHVSMGSLLCPFGTILIVDKFGARVDQTTVPENLITGLTRDTEILSSILEKPVQMLFAEFEPIGVEILFGYIRKH